MRLYWYEEHVDSGRKNMTRLSMVQRALQFNGLSREEADANIAAYAVDPENCSPLMGFKGEYLYTFEPPE